MSKKLHKMTSKTNEKMTPSGSTRFSKNRCFIIIKHYFSSFWAGPGAPNTRPKVTLRILYVFQRFGTSKRTKNRHQNPFRFALIMCFVFLPILATKTDSKMPPKTSKSQLKTVYPVDRLDYSGAWLASGTAPTPKVTPKGPQRHQKYPNRPQKAPQRSLKS